MLPEVSTLGNMTKPSFLFLITHWFCLVIGEMFLFHLQQEFVNRRGGTYLVGNLKPAKTVQICILLQILSNSRALTGYRVSSVEMSRKWITLVSEKFNLLAFLKTFLNIFLSPLLLVNSSHSSCSHSMLLPLTFSFFLPFSELQFRFVWFLVGFFKNNLLF